MRVYTISVVREKYLGSLYKRFTSSQTGKDFQAIALSAAAFLHTFVAVDKSMAECEAQRSLIILGLAAQARLTFKK